MIILVPEIPDTGRPFEMSARGREKKLGHKVAGTEAPSQVEDKLDMIHWGTIRALNPRSIYVNLQGSRCWDCSGVRGGSAHLASAVPTPGNWGGRHAHGSDKGRARLPLGNRDGQSPGQDTEAGGRALPSEAISAKVSSITSRYRSL